MFKYAKEIEMTWDAAVAEASLPRDTAFTFMHLLVMKGQAPVEAQADAGFDGAVDRVLSLAARKTAQMIETAFAGLVRVARAMAADLVAPAYTFMDLLAENGHTPAWARLAYGGRMGLSGLAVARGAVVAQGGWANDDWQAPANANDAQKVA